MRCEICKKNQAGIRFAEIHRGTLKVRTICDACARATGIAEQLERTVVSLGEAIGDAMTTLLQSSTGANAAACPACGMTLAEFKQHGHLGCEHCFEAFAVVLVPLLERAVAPRQKPVNDERRTAPAAGDDAARRIALAQRLQEAVASEEYELAARLRDELKSLETAVAE